ncbi:MAG: hypothetical protein AB7S26_01570 [Sandaracinaceae bacterium]
MRRSAGALAFLVLFVARPAAAQPSLACTLEGTGRFDAIRLPLGDAPPLELSFRRTSARVEVSGSDEARIQTTEGLLLTGTIAASGISAALRAPVEPRPGLLRLRPGVPVTLRRLAPLIVDATLTSGLTVEGLEVPCDALRAGEPERTPEWEADAPTRGALVSRGDALTLHLAPDSSVTLTLAVRALRLAEVERRGGWIRVRRDFMSGATVTGWVRARDVTSGALEAFSEIGQGSGGGLGLCGTGRRDAYLGPATLTRGAAIRESRDGRAYATAGRDIQLREVAIAMNDGWAQILRIDGVEDGDECRQELSRLWVRVEDIRLPHGARPPRTARP